MYENRFNTRKTDPLVEAVRQAQQDGEYRRQAEALVNEAFGVYSRKAVVREDLAAYDAALEEAYADLKEGNKENKEKKKEHEEKTGLEHIKKVGGFPGQSLKRTARSLTKEEKADKDYDKDGKIESEKDEVWGSRFRAAKKAGKMDEAGPVDAGSYEGSKSVTKSAPKEDPSTPKVPMSQLPKPGNAAGDVLSKARDALREAKGTAAVQNLKHRDFKETRHPNKNAVTKAPVPGVSIAEDQVDEAAYSAKAGRAGKDLGKPGKQFSKIAKKAATKYGSEEKGKKVAGAILAKIRAKHMKEDSSFNAALESGKPALNELSAFGSAFANARKAGQSNFSFGGKSFNTKMSSDTPTPPARPSSLSAATPKTNTPGTQGVAVGKSFADIDSRKMTASATDDMASKATARSFFKPGVDANAPKNVPNSQAASMPASERSSISTPPTAADGVKAGLPPARPATTASSGGTSAIPSVPLPPSRPAGVGTSEPGSDASKFVRSQLKEEVQVGDYTYKIV